MSLICRMVTGSTNKVERHHLVYQRVGLWESLPETLALTENYRAFQRKIFQSTISGSIPKLSEIYRRSLNQISNPQLIKCYLTTSTSLEMKFQDLFRSKASAATNTFVHISQHWLDTHPTITVFTSILYCKRKNIHG